MSRVLGYGDGKSAHLHPDLLKELVDAKVSGMGMAVLCAYLEFTDKGSPLGMHVHMGHEYATKRADIADELGVSEQSVHCAVRSLVRKGVLGRLECGHNGSPSRYVIIDWKEKGLGRWAND